MTDTPADVLALASIEVDISSVQPGQTVTFTWRSHPLFVRRRTAEEIEAARAVKPEDLLDPVARNANLPENAPATDANREIKPEWLVVVGVCTHLGCVTQWKPDAEMIACPCHGSKFKSDGTKIEGPAPRPLPHFAISLTADGELLVDKLQNIKSEQVLKV